MRLQRRPWPGSHAFLFLLVGFGGDGSCLLSTCGVAGDARRAASGVDAALHITAADYIYGVSIALKRKKQMCWSLSRHS